VDVLISQASSGGAKRESNQLHVLRLMKIIFQTNFMEHMFLPLLKKHHSFIG